MPAFKMAQSRPPHAVSICSQTRSLASESLTSAAITRLSLGSVPAISSSSSCVRDTKATLAPPWENAVASTDPRPRPAPVIITLLPATSPGCRKVTGISIGASVDMRVIINRPIGTLIVESPSMSTNEEPMTQPGPDNGDAWAMNNDEFGVLFRQMLRIRFFEERASVLYRDRRDSRLRPSLDRTRSVSRRCVLGAVARGRHRVEPSRPWPLHRQRCATAFDVRRADGSANRIVSAASVDPCTSPTWDAASTAPTESSAPAYRSPVASQRR